VIGRIWRAFFPSGEPSPLAKESIARTEAVTEMLKADADYWRAEKAKLEADEAEDAARRGRGR